MNNNRRKFIKGVATTAALLPFSNLLASAEATVKSSKYPVMFFTKPLDEYDSEFMAETLSMAGVDGFDLQVRPGGRVEPKRVGEDLPKMVELGKKHGLTTGMMVTAIKDSTDPYAEDVLKGRREEWDQTLPVGYYDYDYKIGVMASLAEIKVSWSDWLFSTRNWGYRLVIRTIRNQSRSADVGCMGVDTGYISRFDQQPV